MTFQHPTILNQCESLFYVQDTTDAIFANSAAFATQVFNAAVSSLVPALPSVVQLTGVVFEDIRALPYVGADYPQTPTVGTGHVTTGNLPTSTAFVLKKVTGNLGRSGRGRWYWPLWDAFYMTAVDAVSAATATAFAGALASFQAGVEVGAYPCKMGVVSFQHGGAVVNPGLFQQITAWSYADLLVDNQRRRLAGRGR